MFGYRKRVLLSIFLISLASTALFIVNVDPRGKPLPVLLIPVIITWIMVFTFVKIVSLVFIGKELKLLNVISFAVSTAVIFLLLISGVGELTVGDFVLVVSLVGVGSLYFYKTWA